MAHGEYYRADSDIVDKGTQSLLDAIPDSGLRMPARLPTDRDVYVLVWSDAATVEVVVLGHPTVSAQRLAALLDSAVRGSRLEEYDVEWSRSSYYSAADAYFSDSQFGALKRTTYSPLGRLVHQLRSVGFVPHAIVSCPDYCEVNLPKATRCVIDGGALYDANEAPSDFVLQSSAALPGYAFPVLVLLIVFPLLAAGGHLLAFLSAAIPVIPIGFRRRIFPWLTCYPLYLVLIFHLPLALMVQYSRFAEMLVDLWSTDNSQKLPEQISAFCHIGPILLALFGWLAALSFRRLYGPRNGDYVPVMRKGHYSRLKTVVVRVVGLAPMIAGVLLLELRGRHAPKGLALGALDILGLTLVFLGRWIGAQMIRFVAFRFLGGRSSDPSLTARARDIARRMGVGLRSLTIDDTPYFGQLYANAFAYSRGRVHVTRKLVDELSPDELDTVIAHEIAHIKCRDGLRGWAIFLSSVAALWLPFLILFEFPGVHGFLVFLPLAVLPYLGLASLVAGAKWLSRRRELRADRMSVEATRNVEAAESMLRKLAYYSPVPYLVAMDRCTTHPGIETRITALRKAAAEMGCAPIEVPAAVQ
jgi:Zn-dependent protease with chaperone function